MEDVKKRDLMRDAYKLLEKYEKPLREAAFWEALCADCKAFVSRWDGIYKEYAAHIGLAIVESLEKECKAHSGSEAT